MAGILFIISAPSGSGKSTLVSELRKQVSGVDFSISWTTRSPRGSEEHGREYYFTTKAEFDRMVHEGMFLEHAEVFGHCYGTARKSLASQIDRLDAILDGLADNLNDAVVAVVKGATAWSRAGRERSSRRCRTSA